MTTATAETKRFEFDPDREIEWYRTPLPADVLKKLNERSDLLGFLQAGGYLATVVATGVLAYLAFVYLSWPWVVAAVFLHGTVSAFMINGVHELVHGTVFRTRWLNELFCSIFAFIGWINHRRFWGSHTEHHKFTLHPPDDLEVVLPIKLSFWNYMRFAIINTQPKALPNMIRNQWRIARGRFEGEWEQHLFPEEAVAKRRAVMNWSRFLLIGHTLVAVASIATGQWIIPVLVSLTPLYGHWLFWLCNNTQHVGLVDNVPDFRLCCRTIYLNPIVQFLCWHMNYHIEHHMYAGVPCYRLGQLHRAIKHDLPPIRNGLRQAWTEIGFIVMRQAEDPDYQFRQLIPQDRDQRQASQRRERTSNGKSKARRPKVGPDGRPYRRWECTVCGFIYDEARGLPEEGIAPGTRWEDIPDDWSCPDCGVAKADFVMVELGPTEVEDDEVVEGATGDAADNGEARDGGEQTPVVIIGSGLAGYSVAREMRSLGSERPITILSRDGGQFYSKPMLSNALAEGRTPTTLVKETPEAMAQRYRLDVRPGVSVQRIDRQRRVVVTDAGEVPYGSLVLAVGADQIVLPLEGDATDRVHRVNDLDSYAAFREQLEASASKRVLIIGAGLIGCEFANDLAPAGYTVHAVDLAPLPLSRLAPEPVGRALADRLSTIGVTWHFETAVRSINAADDGALVCELATGERITVDAVLSAVGLRPRTALAAEAGLEVGRGIRVSSELRTSDPHIFALGDCAEIDGVVRPFVMPLFECARTLARTLTGAPTAVSLPAMPVVVKTPACPLIVCPPAPGVEGQWTCEGDAPDLVARCHDASGQLIGFALAGEATHRKAELLRELAPVARRSAPSPSTSPARG